MGKPSFRRLLGFFRPSGPPNPPSLPFAWCFRSSVRRLLFVGCLLAFALAPGQLFPPVSQRTAAAHEGDDDPIPGVELPCAHQYEPYKTRYDATVTLNAISFTNPITVR